MKEPIEISRFWEGLECVFPLQVKKKRKAAATAFYKEWETDRLWHFLCPNRMHPSHPVKSSSLTSQMDTSEGKLFFEIRKRTSKIDTTIAQIIVFVEGWTLLFTSLRISQDPRDLKKITCTFCPGKQIETGSDKKWIYGSLIITISFFLYVLHS